jgi:predicted helicase
LSSPMNLFALKPTNKAVQAYYDEIQNQAQLRLFSEGAVSPAFAGLLRYCARPFGWTLSEQYALKRGDRTIRVDGVLLDSFKLVHGVWEAKDTADDLEKEVRKKLQAGYPKDNTIFQAPERAIIWQNGQQIFNEDISRPSYLVEALGVFFAYQPPAFEQWQQAAEEFKLQVPELAAGLLGLIERERRTNQRFIRAFAAFTDLCRQTINPNLSTQAVEEMLIQHMLTERLFSKVFDNPDFVERNVIAHEIEKVILALTSAYFSRSDFLKPLDRFYGAIETTAATIDDFSQKQYFLNTVYEKFFQGFSVRVADTHGIVYTPQPIVEFMIRSVEDILQKEFDRSLGDEGVHILDPFVGTGNFIVRIMRQIPRIRLPYKYTNELHCNEVMLLPYYITSMNIEHAYYELTGTYQPFAGVCLVDTFEMAEGQQMSLFTQENTERVARQRSTPIFVIIGNPPYNAGQVNENDNNKNRKYPAVDRRVAETYGKSSQATLVRKLNDPYVKAIRWASDRIGEEGIIAFVTNSSFVSEISFDGMRQHLKRDFDTIYILDLGGNVRKNPKLSGTTHNVFGIQVGVSINLLVRRQGAQPKQARIYYASVDANWRKEQKYDFLDKKGYIGTIQWQEIHPDRKHTWLPEGMSDEFDALMPLGTKAAKGSKQAEVQSIFKTYSLGVSTNRDSVVYDFDRQALERRVGQFCDDYNAETARYQQKGRPADIDRFVSYEKVQWSSTLKNHTRGGVMVTFDSQKVRTSLYRPFTQMLLYYDNVLNDRPGHFQQILPTPTAETENRLICANQTAEKPFTCLMTNRIPNLVMCGGFGAATQCFPLYTYDEDGSHRRENITDWALVQFHRHYKDASIGKEDIFNYVYALLYHPQYREKYAANLRRELPRIPFAPDFWAFAEAGKRLAELHVHYEDQSEYPLKWLETKDVQLNWCVEKMKLSKDKTQLIYNDLLTLAGIPPETFEYRLGNRSALEWIVDQYRVTTDQRSGISNDPNRLDDPQYILRLIGKVITVSLETVKIVKGLPKLE